MHSEPDEPPTRGRPPDPSRTDPELADALSDRHARAAVDCLRRHDGPVELADLSRRVVARITDEPPEDVPDDVVRRVRTWLHHGHLPALRAHGVVEYDPDAGVVALAERGRTNRPGGDDPSSAGRRAE